MKKSKVSSAKKTTRKKTSVKPSGRGKGGKNHTVTPKERWLLITESARARVQKHGFIGGDPIKDWLAAEREIDARYTTDYESIFSRTETSEIVEQIKGVFAGHGLTPLELDDFIDKQRGSLKTLAHINRELIDGTSEFASQQAALLQESVGEAAKTLKSLAHGEIDTAGMAKQAELSMQAMENVLTRVKSLANLVGIAAPAKAKAKTRVKVKTKVKAKAKTRAKSGASANRRKTPGK